MSAEVYICRIGDVVVYVGYTTTGFDYRWTCHRNASRWAEFITDFDHADCEDVAQARAVEVALIQHCRPLMNVHHNPDFAGMDRAERRALLEERLEELPSLAMDRQMEGMREICEAAGTSIEEMSQAQPDPSAA